MLYKNRIILFVICEKILVNSINCGLSSNFLNVFGFLWKKFASAKKMLSDIDSSDACDGIDLSHYQNELARQRSSHTINIRRTFQSDEQNFHSRIFKPRYRVPSFEKTEINIDDIVNAFENNDLPSIEKICLYISSSQNVQIINSITENDDFLDLISSAASYLNSPGSLEAYLSLIITLSERESASNMITDALFIIRDYLNEFPQIILTFYVNLPNSSVFGRDAMICTGIIEDIFLFCHENKDPNLVALAANSLHSIFCCNEIVANEIIRMYFQNVIDLLKLPNIDAVYFVMLALIDIISQDKSFIEELYNQNVHIFVSQAVENEKLTWPSICLAGNMANCEYSGIVKLYNSGVITKISQLPLNLFNGDAFFLLSNCAEAAIEIVLPLFNLEFLGRVKALLNYCPFAIFKDAAYFLATLLVFAPFEIVKVVLSLGITDFINQMLESGQEFMVIRGLDAINRVFFLVHSSVEVKKNLTQFFLSEDLMENLERLQMEGVKLIACKSKTVENYIHQFYGDVLS
ncbi:hypothetical protein TRFO_18710 [Tritrichomonas foetus]|uniref:Uncharacterized protein n=1 Tax=Tritrichomonas foetus TaxID=1144522 RepID=A0A1J4KKY6_9EUKA|nr:hypothetical protein TRFO_18710 [Tritrichomonas foetus]|eukprot:OHT11802.1 hypothetical protein TRFO_18710 [Tritrichomonas foetus]